MVGNAYLFIIIIISVTAYFGFYYKSIFKFYYVHFDSVALQLDKNNKKNETDVFLYVILFPWG